MAAINHQKGIKIMPFQTTHPLYNVWQSMKRRCDNPNAKPFKDYGGRGIFVCDRWLNSFSNFVSDMPPRPAGHEINRIDNDGPYSPENCNWVTHKENMQNRRNTVRVVIDGETYLVSVLSEKYGIKSDTITHRVKQGMSFADCVTKNKHHDLSGFALGGKASGAKKMAMTHCKHGHEFTEKNTGRTTKGTRICRICKNAGQTEYMRRKAAR